MRIVFMGTPDFAVPSLEALIEAGHQVVGVFSQPDKPVGRHQNKLQPPPVKVCAQARGIPVFQPEKLRDGTALQLLRELSPEMIAAVAYGRLLPEEILTLPPRGCINVHASLLPKYRGSAPINWAVINGETETGITIMYMAPELDAGDMIARAVTPIGPDESAEELYGRLARMGGTLLAETAAQIEAGAAQRIPQDHSQATLAPMLSRALSPIDWTRSAREIHNQIRGLFPWPAASTDVISGQTIKVFQSETTGETASVCPGTVVSAGREGIGVACGDGKVLRLTVLQPPGSKRMSAAAYLAGHPLRL